jgi:hypothetical protein
MSSRHTWFWLLLAAGLFGFIFFYQRHTHKLPAGPVKILPGVRLSEVSSIQVRPGATGQAQLEIRAERTNNIWLLTDPPSPTSLRADTNSWLPYPAQAASIESLIAALEQLTPAIYISESELKAHPKADEEFGFTSPQASIVIMQRGYRVHLLIGARTNPGDQVYLQVVGVEGAYVASADLLKHIPRSANDWRDTTVINLGNSALDRIAVTNSSTALVRLVLQRDSTDRLWRMVWPLQARADNLRIQDSLQKLQNLRVRQFVSDDARTDLEPFGLAPPELELSMGQGTNTLALLQFGRSPTNDPGQIYARRYGQYSIFTVDKEALSSWRAAVNDFRDSHLLDLPQPVDSVEVVGPEMFSLQHQTNDAWRVLPQNLTADSGMVQDLFAVLTGARIIGFVKDVVNPPDLVDFGLASPLRRFIVNSRAVDSSVTASNEVCFGLSTNQSDKVFVKRTDESSVYALSTNDFARLPSAGWQLRDRKLWHFSEEDIARVSIHQAGKTFQVLRNDRYKWSVAPGSQGSLNDLAVEDTVRGLVQASAVVWVARGDQDRARFGINEKGLHITLELKNGQKASIEFGSEAPSNNAYASVILEGEVWILEFPWIVFRDVLSYLSVLPGQ